uniref:Cullin family profile domain-containing protein n=1 Tax=Amphimedon queenslandica TaxID=400682 RepID=A0A1X7SDI1_AMPQE
MLAKRLVQQISASDDAEASMISKLKQACGFEYTSKLQRMFQDMSLSKDLNDKFRQHLSAGDSALDCEYISQNIGPTKITGYYIGGSLYVGLRLIFQDGGRFYDFQTLTTLLSYVVQPYKWLR